MKTRIIQNEPEEPDSTPQAGPAVEQPPRSSNLAARIGRWSAARKKGPRSSLPSSSNS
jgi:hypothetical protein